MKRVLLCSVALLWTVPASAGVFYLDPAGSDSYDCTSATFVSGTTGPCLTITRGQTVASSGDTVVLATGTYTGFSSGQLSLTEAGITYQGYADGGACPTTTQTDVHAIGIGITTRPAPTVIVQGEVLLRANDLTWRCLHVQPGSGSPVPSVKHAILITGNSLSGITVSNNIISDGGTANGCKFGISTDAAANISAANTATGVTITQNYVTRCEIGLSVVLNSSTVSLNEFDDMRWTADASDVDYMRGWGDGLTVQQNYAHSTDLIVGVTCFSSSACHTDCFQTFNTTNTSGEQLKNFTFTRNTCFNLSQGMISEGDLHTGANRGVPSGQMDGYTITNNIFAKTRESEANGFAWCLIIEGTLNVVVYHNTCVGDTNGTPYGYRSGTTATHRNNLHHTAGASPLTTAIAANVAIASITRTDTTATVTLSAAPSTTINTGSYVQISGANETDYNGVFQITKIDSTSFSYTVANSPTTPATGTLRAHLNSAQSLTFTNNLLYDAGVTYTNTTANWMTNLCTANTCNSDPLLESLATDNYRLVAGSPAIDAGASVGVALDLYSVTRDGTQDLGALEYVYAVGAHRGRFHR